MKSLLFFCALQAESRCVSASDSISRGEDEGEAEVQGNVELSVGSIRDEDVDEPESPTTPCSTSRPPVLECPDAPYLRSRCSIF